MTFKTEIPKFPRLGDSQKFFNTLSSRVNEYFKQEGISRTGNLNLYIKTFVMLLVFLVPYFLLILFPIAVWVQVLLCVLMGVGMAGVGMNAMHDGNHGSYSKNPIVNKIMGSTIYLCAGNANNWKVQHNVLHHTYTNIQGHDEDLDAGRIIRFSKHSDWLSIHKYQHIYAVFLYGLLTLNWSIITDFKQTISYRNRKLFPSKNSILWHWVKLITFKIVYFLLWVVIPILFMPNPWWHIVIGFLIMHYTAGMVLSVIFQLAHIVEDTEVMITPKGGEMDNNWAAHQLFTTANFSGRSLFLNWVTGGLNHQIEHHLFPNVSHIHYKNISPIVKETAKEFGLPYHENKTIGKALVSHFRYLKSLTTPPYQPAV